VGAVYEASEQLSFYSGYARGKFVSIQTESTSLTPVPESSSQVEAGIKAEIIPGRLNANLAVFETKRDKYFVTLVPGGNPEPVGKQRSRGVELDVVGSPFDGLSIIGNFAYVDAINRSAALSSVTLLATNQSMLGKRISSTPETSGALWANYTVPQGPLAGLGFGAGVTYKGAVLPAGSVGSAARRQQPDEPHMVQRADLHRRTPWRTAERAAFTPGTFLIRLSGS
jgi:iron complex outermembrane recepter protein